MKRIENIEKPFVERMFASGFSVVEILENYRHHKCTKLEKLCKRLPAHSTEYDQKSALHTYDDVERKPFFLFVITVYKKEEGPEHIEYGPVTEYGYDTQ